MFEPGYLAQAIMQEREREIQAMLLLKAARRSRPQSTGRGYRRILAFLGGRLSAWGEELQRRYGDCPAPACT